LQSKQVEAIGEFVGFGGEDDEGTSVRTLFVVEERGDIVGDGETTVSVVIGDIEIDRLAVSDNDAVTDRERVIEGVGSIRAGASATKTSELNIQSSFPSR